MKKVEDIEMDLQKVEDIEMDLLYISILYTLIQRGCTSKLKALSVYEIQEQFTNTSLADTEYRTIYNRLNILKGLGYVEEGLKHKKRNRYYITELGMSIAKK